MQSQMSTATGVAPKPSAPAPAPHVVRAPEPPRKRRAWLVLSAFVVMAAAGWWLWTRTQSATDAAQKGAAPAAVRTATVATRDVVRTIRLTGSTAAEKYASLLVPRMRGSRGDGLREGRTFSSPGANYTVTSNAGSTTGGMQVSAPSGGGSGGEVASTAGSGGGASAAMRSATSRVSRGGGGSSVRGGGRSTGAPAGGDLGSTESALRGTGFAGGSGGSGASGGFTGGGGSMRGGGGSEFSLVLQNAALAGSFVNKGDVVAEFDRQYMMNRLEDYRSAYAQMESSFKKLKAEVDVQMKAHAQSIDMQKAALDKARLDLKTLPVMGAIDTERIKLAAEEAEAKYKQLLAETKHVKAGYDSQVKVAELELKQAKVELDRAEHNADRMVLKAALEGLVVMQTLFRSGQMAQIQAGDQLYAGMRFMQIVDPSSMVVNASVNQVDADTMRIGQKAKVRFDAFPGLELPATVHAIGAMTKPGGMRAQYVKEIPVVLKLGKLDPRVIPDLSVSVDLELEAEKQVASVPLGAVFQDRADSKPFVFVKSGTGWERREVELGISSNVAAAVRSGVRPGEVIAAEYPPGVETRKKGQS